MDPLSITASITAVLQLTQALATYANSVRKASEQQKAVAIEASTLYSLLTNLKFKVEDAKSTDPWFNQVKLLAVEDGPLQQLRVLLEDLVGKIPAASASKTTKLSLSRLTWHFAKKDVEELLNRIERLKSLINLALVNDLTTLAQAIKNDATFLVKQTEQIQIGIDVIQQSINDELKNKLSHWLGVPDPSINYKAAISKRQANTGLWLTGATSFKDWKSSTSSSSMWLYGKAGCGKTVLSSTALEDILQSTVTSPDSYSSYFFFDFNDRQKQSWQKAVRSLLFQFCLQLRKCLLSLGRLHQSCQNGNQQPADDTLLALLGDCVATAGNKYILLDALDECTDREPLLDVLESLIQRKEPGLHIFMTSRHERDIQQYLDSIVDHRIDIQSAVIKDDIQIYVQERMNSDRRLKKWPSSVKDEITQVLMNKADGMFRWVYCQIESLRQCVRLSALKRALDSLPKSLDETYERMINQISSSGELDCAIWLLQWLCFSNRPLRLSELNEVLAIRLDDKAVFEPEERLSDPFDMTSVCPSLITYVEIEDDHDEYGTHSHSENDENTDFDDVPNTSHSPDLVEVRLAHYSVKEYLLSERTSLQSCFQASRSHELIAQGCLGYLLHMCEKGPLTKELLAECPLAIYAAWEWPQHVREVESQLSKNTLNTAFYLVLEERSCQILWEHLCYVACGNEFDCFDEDLEVPPPIISASQYGLVDLVSESLSRRADIEARGKGGSTALHLAASMGYEEVVQLLLDRGADIEARDKHNRTPLHSASMRRHEKVIQLLIDRGADIEARVKGGSTALHLAAFMGCEEVVQLLIDRGADIEAQDKHNWTPLHTASLPGFEKVIQLLLDRGADVNAVTASGDRPLDVTLSREHSQAVQVLRDHGAIKTERNHGPDGKGEESKGK